MRQIVTDIEKLREKSSEINLGQINRLNSSLVLEMKEVLERSKGVGLSAIQVGVPIKLFIMKTNRGEILTIFNPKIIDKYDEITVPGEGCLSLPGKRVNTRRYKYVEAEWNEHRQIRRAVFCDMEAVIFQHENDHLSGILMTDRQVQGQKVGRNAPCPCGSGKKYKKCCLGKDETESFSI